MAERGGLILSFDFKVLIFNDWAGNWVLGAGENFLFSKKRLILAEGVVLGLIDRGGWL
jgi:hypothetical protein